jgi:hypothetical protein
VKKWLTQQVISKYRSMMVNVLTINKKVSPNNSAKGIIFQFKLLSDRNTPQMRPCSKSKKPKTNQIYTYTLRHVTIRTEYVYNLKKKKMYKVNKIWQKNVHTLTFPLLYPLTPSVHNREGGANEVAGRQKETTVD